MKTGNTVLHETNLITPMEKESYYKASLPHRLYHRVEAHFGKGPFTTSFTLTHGPFMLHGYVKSDQEVSIPIVFEEA